MDLKVFSHFVHFSDEILTFVFASSWAALVYKSLSCSPGRQRLFTLSENMLENKEGRIFHVPCSSILMHMQIILHVRLQTSFIHLFYDIKCEQCVLKGDIILLLLQAVRIILQIAD